MIATITAFLCFVLLTLILFAGAEFVSRRLLPEADFPLQVLVGCAVSILVLAAFVAICSLLSLPSTITAWLLRIIGILSVTNWLLSGRLRLWFGGAILPGLLVFLAYYLFVSATVAFPNGNLGDIRAATVQTLTGLPIDNLIPYNVARYFVENIPPQKLDVVPYWNFVDRGPLAGLFTAAVFLIIGIQESGHWLVPQAGPFAIYQFSLEYLNLLSLFAIFLMLQALFDRRAAVIGTVVLCSGYFFFANVIFTWPKLFMAFFVVVACFAWTGRVAGLFVGVLLAGALLAHDSALFSIVAFFACLFCCQGSPRRPWVDVAKCLMGLIITYSPWAFYKMVSGAPPNRVLLLNLFCYREEDLSNVSFFDVFQHYLQSHSLVDIFHVRLGNLWFPFNVFHPIDALRLYWNSPYQLAFALSDTVFFQLVYSVGPLFLFLALGTIVYQRSSPKMHTIRPLVWAGLGAIVPASLILGCPLTTFSHHWAYPAIAAVAILAAWGLHGLRMWQMLLLGIASAMNLLLGYIMFVLHPTSFLYQHAANSYWGAVLLTAVLFVLTLAALAGSAERR